MIELRDFLNIFVKHKGFLAVGLLLGLFFGGFLAWRDAQGVHSLVQLSVYRQPNSNFVASPNVQYDGYYIVETSRLYGERLGDFFTSGAPQTILSSATNIQAEITNVLRLSPQDIEVALWAKDELALNKAASEVSSLAEEHLIEISQKTNEAFIFRVNASSPLLERPRPAYIFWIFGATIGFILGATVAFMKEYFTSNR